MMKKILTFILLLTWTALSVQSQDFGEGTSEPTPLGPQRTFKVTQFNGGLGAAWDRYQSMSLDHLMRFARTPENLQNDLSGMSEEVTTQSTGLGLFTGVSFAWLNQSTGEYREHQEVRVGLGLYSPREAMVSYKNEGLDTSIVYCNIHNEVSLELEYILRTKLGKRWHVYAGAGMNNGFTYGDQMILIYGKYFEPGEHPSTQESEEMNKLTYDAKSIFYSRLYIPYGIHLQCGKHVLIGCDFRTGVGFQAIQGEPLQYLERTGAFVLGMKYRL